MTINGFLRAVSAAQRRTERTRARQARIYARAEQLRAKENAAAHAAAEVEEFDERMLTLTSIHRHVGDSIDWEELARRPIPKPPEKPTEHEDAAVRDLQSFRPSIVQKILGKAEKQRLELEAKVVEARASDQAQFEQIVKAHRHYVDQLSTSAAFAKRVLSGDVSSFKAAIDELDPFGEISETGFEVTIAFPSSKFAVVDIVAVGDEVVPTENKSLTKAGKVSIKPMPAIRRIEVYQDFICGCALRIARELLALFPIETVVVNVATDILDPTDGHVRTLPILAASMPRPTFDKINFATVDASDSMRLFVTNMNFKRGTGFSPVDRLDAPFAG